MPPRKKTLFLVLVFLVGAGVAAYFFFSQSRRPVKELPVRLIQIRPEGEGIGSLPKEALIADQSSGPAAFFRLNHLRAELLKVRPKEEKGNRITFQYQPLDWEEFAVLNPGEIEPGRGLNPIAGIEDEALIRLTVAAGIKAIAERNNQETLRFLSPDYSDSWGFNARLLELVIQRAFKEFDQPRIELTGLPVIRIRNNQALIFASLRLTAGYRGRRNYLVGDSDHPNDLILRMGKTALGWKLENIEGLRPLGFEESFFKLLGAEVGLPLTEKEKTTRQQACMPCRERMAERFGPSR